jgi:hypothetical protein
MTATLMIFDSNQEIGRVDVTNCIDNPIISIMKWMIENNKFSVVKIALLESVRITGKVDYFLYRVNFEYGKLEIERLSDIKKLSQAVEYWLKM